MKPFVIQGEPEVVTNIRKEILEKFKDLEFVESTHQYFLPQENGIKTELPSVSHVTHQFAIPFETELEAEKYAAKHGETKEYWMDQWRYKSLKATTNGTIVHEFAENCFYTKYKLYDLITPKMRDRFVEDKKWLIPIQPKEEAAKQFWLNFPENVYPVLAETKVYTKKYAGTFDLLCYFKHPVDDSKSGLLIMDWKTNSTLTKSYSRTKGKMLLEPFTDYFDEPKSLYTLQLSAYQVPLEDMGYKIIGRRLMHLKDDGTYDLIPLNDETKKLREALEL